MTIGVRCPYTTPWTVYVPVSIEVEVSVLVLHFVRPLARARRLRSRRCRTGENSAHCPGQASAYVSDFATLQGHRLKRARLPIGTALTVGMLQPDLRGFPSRISLGQADCR